MHFAKERAAAPDDLGLQHCKALGAQADRGRPRVDRDAGEDYEQDDA